MFPDRQGLPAVGHAAFYCGDAGRQVASGTYAYRVEMPAAGFSQTRTMSVVR